MKLISVYILLLFTFLTSCNRSKIEERPSLKGSDYSKRWVSDTVNPNIVLGTWLIDGESKLNIQDWVKRHPRWNIWTCPFEKIEIIDNGMLRATPNTDILLLDSIYSTRELLIGEWTLNKDSIGDYYYDGRISTSTLHMKFEYPENHLHFESLYIMVNSDKSKLWTFIGDPDNRIFAKYVKE